MNKLINLLKSYYFIVIFIFLSAGFFHLFKYIIWADSISYMSIAQKYATGDFKNAINGLWGPLISWLLAIILKFPVQPLFASKILTMLIGIFQLIIFDRFIRLFSISKSIYHVLMIIAAFSAFYFSFSGLGVDQLLLCFSLIYIILLLNPKQLNIYTQALFIGIIASCGYFSKPYFLPFFLVHFTLFNIIRFFYTNNKNKRNIVLHYLTAMTIFIFISGIWILIIHNKYHYYTYSTLAEYANSFYNPNISSINDEQPWAGIYDPPNSTATSIFEDMSYIPRHPWSPFSSVHNFVYQMKRIYSHLNPLYEIILLKFNPFAIVVILIMIISVLKSILDKKIDRDKSILLLIFIIFPSGFLMTHLLHRHLWLNYTLILLFSGIILTVIFRVFPKYSKKTLKYSIIASFFFLSMKYPVQEIIGLMKIAENDKSLYHGSKDLMEKYHIKGSIVSNSKWNKTLSISYLTKNQYLGVIKITNDQNFPGSNNNVINYLKNKSVRYLFLWDIDPVEVNNLNYKLKIKVPDIPDLTVIML